MSNTILSKVKLNEINQKKINHLKSTDKIIVKAQWHEVGTTGGSQAELFENKELHFDCMKGIYDFHTTAISYGFDNSPHVYCDFGGVAWLMSLAYGCDLIKIGGRINSEPLYFSADDTYKFEKINNIFSHGLYPLIDERIIEFQKMYKHIPISIPDNQTPLDVLTCIIKSEESIYMMYDNPDEIKRIINILTDSVIEVARHYERLIDNFAGFGFETGMALSDDNAAFISPGFYEEFALPCMNRLSDEFGGIMYHCCMGY